MIQFDLVDLSFMGHPLFEGASFTLQRGERCSLVGRNGSGKSTLFRLISKEIEPDRGSITTPKGYRIGYLQQHIHFTQSTLLGEVALHLPDNEKDHLYQAEAILFGLGFSEEDMERPPSSFSGGYQLRLHLAKVLVAKPQCLLLDEPTNYLDLLSVRWLTQFLSRWPGEFILISHDRDFLDHVSTHTMGIHRQRLNKIAGSTLDFFEKILREEELHEKTRIKSEKRKAHLQSYVERFGAKASKAAQAQARIKMIAREPILEKLNALSELSFSFQEASFPGQRMLKATDLYFSYTDLPLIEGVSLEIAKGERIAIIGKNGRGKSTLLKILSQELAPIQGKVTLSENARIGYFGQTHIQQLNPKLSVEEEIAKGCPRALSFTEVKAIAGAMLFSGELSLKKIEVLSGGEKSRVLLGQIIAKPCNLLFLDEPTHHLDIESIEALIDALEEFSGAVVIVTHSELILRRLHLTQIIHCEEGKQTLFLGTYDEFLEKMGWEESDKKPSKKTAPSFRKEKADLIQERSRIVKPLETLLQEYEQKIAALEEEKKQHERALMEGKESGMHAKMVGRIGKEIEALEALHMKVYEQILECRKKFDAGS